MARWWAIFGCLLMIQGAVWWYGLKQKPHMEIVPNVPGVESVQALSFGDSHAFFRILGLTLQNFGDTFGRFTALKDYNFERLERWMRLLDKLDDRSDYIPSLASYYFSQTQNHADVKYMVAYLEEHSEGRLDTKWWWRTQAVYLANHRLNDTEWALRLAKPLIDLKGVPPWVNQLPAFIHEKRGEFGDALAIMEHISEHAEDLKPGELNFIRHFITERMHAIDSANDGADNGQ